MAARRWLDSHGQEVKQTIASMWAAAKCSRFRMTITARLPRRRLERQDPSSAGAPSIRPITNSTDGSGRDDVGPGLESSVIGQRRPCHRRRLNCSGRTISHQTARLFHAERSTRLVRASDRLNAKEWLHRLGHRCNRHRPAHTHCVVWGRIWRNWPTCRLRSSWFA
jgi:hypothetical protein